jgi:hypothetical protein
MLDLMAVNTDESVPLYVHTVYRILREMRILQGKTGSKFDYHDFKDQLMDSGLSSAQLGPLKQRLDTLESFMSKAGRRKGKGEQAIETGTDWTPKVGSLTLSLTWLILSAWLAHDSGSIVSLCNSRERVLAIQHMSKPVRRTKSHRSSSDCPR